MPKAKASVTPWKSRIVGLTNDPPESLTAHPRNWHVHPAAQQAALRSVLGELGWITGVLKNDTTGHIIDGHDRVDNAIKTGQATVPVIHVELSEAEENLALATFDPLNSLAQTDQSMLDDLLREATTDDAGLREFLDSLGGQPEFLPVGEGEQGRLDQRTPVECPVCGHEFVP